MGRRDNKVTRRFCDFGQRNQGNGCITLTMPLDLLGCTSVCIPVSGSMASPLITWFIAPSDWSFKWIDILIG